MSSVTAASRAGSEPRPELDNGPATTACVIAIGNLEARIEGLTWQAPRGSLTGAGWAELVELTVLRGHVLARVDDAERATSLVASARMAALFHRFSAALADLDTAAELGPDRPALEVERAAIYQAAGAVRQLA